MRGSAGVDRDGPRFGRQVGPQEGVETHGEFPLIPLDPPQVLLEETAHGKLPGGREVDQFPVPIEEELPGIGAELLPEQQALDAELLLGEGQRLTQGLERHAVIGPERPQHVGFDKIPERELGRFLAGGANQRAKVPGALRRGIGAADGPGP